MLPSLSLLSAAAPPLPGVLALSPDQWRDWLAARGEKPLRRRQVRRWLLHAGVADFGAMTDLPVSLRQALAQDFQPLETRVERHLVADDATHKLLLRLGDGHLVECVLIQDAGRRTACISTQVGCGMGCVFCASGLDGVARNLTCGEILEQLVRLRALPPAPDQAPSTETPHRLTHIVVMGMGEPLANLDALLEALETATSAEGLGIGARHVTISTVGLPARIRRLADLGKQYHLAVSLHAPDDPLRTRIVPTNDKTGLPEILAAADYFFERTGRQVTFEYVLLGEVNDRPAQARALARLLQGRRAHINLIPFNEVDGLSLRRPSKEALGEFVEILRRAGLSVKVRKRKGSNIDAACGQLRRGSLEKPSLEEGAAPAR